MCNLLIPAQYIKIFGMMTLTYGLVRRSLHYNGVKQTGQTL